LVTVSGRRRQRAGADRGAADTETPDPFGTAEIRRRVLAAWTAAPARFREDANAEEDLVHGAYRDRLLVELAQNAADAAARAGLPGDLRLSLVDGELRAANTGAPLDAAGVEALSTLRASAKRDAASVGRYGVGFAAVLAVTDAPALLSSSGGVEFSAGSTLVAVKAIPALAGELDRRRGQVPVLRLPWPAAGAPPPGYATEVRLPLLPGAEPSVLAALAALDATLLLALPALARITLDDRVLSKMDGPDGVVLLGDGDTVRHWHLGTASGELSQELLATRPVEERDRPGWTVTCAVPVSTEGEVRPLAEPQVLHAPTPSDERLSLPVRVIASMPFGPDRRRVAPGPITDALIGEIAAAYADLVAALPATPAVLELVPRLGLAAAELDAAVCNAVLDRLRAAPWLPPAGAAGDGAAERIAPVDAVVADDASEHLVDALTEVLPGLLPARWSGPEHTPALTALGVRRLSTSDIVELVSGVDRPARWWRRLYEGLSTAPDREALAALPVPLVDGRTVRGLRGVLLPGPGLPAEAVSALGLRVVAADAAHPLLERLGAQPASAAGVLADERVRAAVAESYDAEDPEPVADAVLALVAAAGVRPGAEPWLADLALPGTDGAWYPAGELLLPDSPLAEVVVSDAPFGRVPASLVARWGADVLGAVGVLSTFAVLRAPGVEVGEVDHDLDGEQDWYAAVEDRLPPQDVPPRLVELVAVRDLELVAADGWAAALPLVAALPGAGDPAVVLLAGGDRVEVPSYLRWWLSTHPVLAGRRPDRLRLPAAAELGGLYDAVDGDPGLLAFAGCLAGLDDVLADPDRAVDLLGRLGDPARTVPAVTLRTAYARLAVALDGHDVDPPAAIRVAPDRVVDHRDAVVLDRPYLLPLLEAAVVPAGGAPGAVADLLDLPFASEVVAAEVTSVAATVRAWADVPGAVLAAQWCGVETPTGAVGTHRPVVVTGGREVGWWPGAGGGPDAVSSAAGPGALGRALAWRLGRWDKRGVVIEALRRPETADFLRAEETLDT
jgi:hypothetical protein